ncbi:MAG: hypothetical protein J0L82_13710 [Deltaproteobacteria bacterium]|nr:hypothetical protein [Deltaproteobacteria bacterium]
MDGFPDGRCIQTITFYGIDTPDFVGPGRIERHDPPAWVKLDGYITRQGPGRPPVPGGGAGPGGRPPGPGGGGVGGGPVRPRPLTFRPLGRTDTFSKSRFEYKEIAVGIQEGRFDGIKIIAKDDSVEVRIARVYFGNGEYVELQNLKLSENQEIYFDFDGPQRRGGRDQDRLITKVTIEAVSSNLFGSKGRIAVEGGR